MPYTLSMSEARQQLTRLPEQLADPHNEATVTVTRHGEPVLAVLPYDLYESIMETLEIVGDPELMQALRQSIKEIEAGQTVSLEELDKRLGL
jgi:prevent-host-death family protein